MASASPQRSALSRETRSGASRERMSTVDTAWLRMDSDGNLMMIVSILSFAEPIALDRLHEILRTRLLPYRRFRSRVAVDLAGTWWQEQDVNFDDHVIPVQLEGSRGSNKPKLEKLVAQLSATPLDMNKPLWQMHVVDNCRRADGKLRQSVIVRIHHCIADGIALVGVLLSMFDVTPEYALRTPTARKYEEADENPWMQLLEPVTKTTVKAIDMSGNVATRYVAALAAPNDAAAKFGQYGYMGGQVLTDAVRMLTMADDSATRLKGIPRGRKKVAWSEPLPLEDVKAIGRFFGCSINDVLMSSVAGAIGGYLRSAGDAVPGDTEIRAMVPVNLRKTGNVQKLGNAFGLVPLVLPVGIEDPLKRLVEVQARMNDLKGGYQALLAMAILGVLGTTPKAVQSEIQNFFAKKASAVMSNVPGPAAPLYLGGSQLEQIMFWVPQSGDIGVGVSILSYNGGVQFGIVTDAALKADPHDIIARFAPEFEKLVMLVLMAQWEAA